MAALDSRLSQPFPERHEYLSLALMRLARKAMECPSMADRRWCMQQGAMPDWVTFTTDETVLLQVWLPGGVRLKFEVEDANNIGVAHWRKPKGRDFFDGAPVTFHGVTEETLDQLLTV